MVKMEISFPGHKRINMELDKEYNSFKIYWPREIIKEAERTDTWKIKKLSREGFIIMDYLGEDPCQFRKIN